MTEFNLIKHEGKAIEKLIETVGKGIGKLYKPRAIRKEADAEAYKLKVLERAKTEAAAETEMAKLELQERTIQRLQHIEERRQQNIEKVIATAAEQLKDEETVSDEPVNEDWATRFFNIVGDISEEELQALWARILAGEVKRPKSFSLRTFEILRNMTNEEANVFMRISNLVISANNGDLNFLYKADANLLNRFGVKYEDILKLIECGLIQPQEGVTLQFGSDQLGKQLIYLSGNYVIIADILTSEYDYRLIHDIPIIMLTRAGSELLKLVKGSPHLDYLAQFAKAFHPNKHTFKADIKYATINSIESDGTVKWNEPLLYFPK